MCQKNLAASRLADFEYSSSRALSISRIGVIFFLQKTRIGHSVHTHTRSAAIHAYKHTRLTSTRRAPKIVRCSARISGGFLWCKLTSRCKFLLRRLLESYWNMVEFPLGYREVVPDQTLPEKWKEITLNTGEHVLTSTWRPGKSKFLS